MQKTTTTEMMIIHKELTMLVAPQEDMAWPDESNRNRLDWDPNICP